MRIYNPQNQFGESLITEAAVTAIKNTILKGMGLSESAISANDFKNLVTLISENATKIEANAESISKLTAGSLEYKTVAYAEDVQATYAKAENYNKILLVPASETISEGVNKYTEYIIVNVGTSTSPSYYAEKLGEIGVDSSKITKEIGDINDKIGGTFSKTSTVASAIAANTTAITNEADCRAKQDKAITDIIGSGFSSSSTVASQLGAVKKTADEAIQGVGTVTSDSTHSVTLTLTENASHNLEGSVSVTAAELANGAFGATDTKLTQAKDVQSAIATAITAEDTAVNGKSVAMESMTGAVTADAKVKVAITGTIGEHSIAVTTNDIASASALSALDTYVKGEAGEGGKGGIEKRLEAVETSIGSGTEGIGSRVKALEDSVGASTDAAKADGSVYARIAATKAVADTALQGITGDDSKAVKIVFTESAAHEVTTAVTVSTAATTGEGNGLKLVVTDTAALATAADVQTAIDAAEARAKSAQTYTADEVTVHVANNQFSAKTGAVAADATTLTTGGQVHTAIETAKTNVKGTTISATNVDNASATNKVKVTLGGTVAAPTIAVATADIASATDLTTEVTARKTDVGAILAGTKHAVGTVVLCSVTAKAGVSGTFTVTKPEGVSSVHIMSVEWKHEDFVCKHDGEDIILWDSSVQDSDFVGEKPAAGDIKVFALVTGTTAKAEGVTA